MSEVVCLHGGMLQCIHGLFLEVTRTFLRKSRALSSGMS
jgi:hypothetical protein